MRTWWQRHWVGLFIILTLFIGVTGQYNLWRLVERPFPGAMIFHFPSPAHAEGYLTHSTPTWWATVQSNDLRHTDQITHLNGQPIGVNQTPVYEQAYKAGEPVTFTIIRDGQTILQPITPIIFTPAHFFDLKMAEIIVGIGAWIIFVNLSELLV